jgi:hypothetical protein
MHSLKCEAALGTVGVQNERAAVVSGALERMNK